MQPDTKPRSWDSATIGLLLAPLLGLFMIGSVGVDERALLGVAISGVLVLVARQGRAPKARIAMAAVPLLAAAALGAVQVPRAVLTALAPGVASARPQDAAWTLALRPDLTHLALADLGLLLAYGLAVAAVAPDRRRVGDVLGWATVGWALVGAVHAMSGAQSLFGLIPVRPGDGAFFAPLVNPNHHGTVLIAGLPFVVSAAWTRGRARDPRALLFVAVALYTLAYPVLSASMGLVGVLAAQGSVALLVSPVRRPVKVGVSVLGLGAAIVAALWVSHAQPEWWALSGRPRVQQWTDTWALLRDHPLAGVGLGGYGAAYEAYRTVPAFAVFAHAHSDLLEFLSETGLAGLIALGIAALVLPWRARSRSLGWTLAVVAVAAHALVDFPWHVPGVALFGVLIVGVWAWGDGDDAPGEGGAWSWGPFTLAAVSTGALIGFAVDDARLDDALVSARLATTCDDTLRAVPARWPASSDLALAVFKACDGDPASLLRDHPDDGEALGEAGAWFAHKHPDRDPMPLLTRAVARAPNDFRAWRVLAVVHEQRGDATAAASAWANAFKHWPQEIADKGKPFDHAFAVLPVGLWWLDALADAPAHWSIRLSRKLLDEQQPDAALLACQQAKRLRPAAHEWTAECAMAEWALGQKDEAKTYLASWRAARPNDVWAFIATAQILSADGVDVNDPEWGDAVMAAYRLRPDERRVTMLLEAARDACPPSDSSGRPSVCVLVDVWTAEHPRKRDR